MPFHPSKRSRTLLACVTFAGVAASVACTGATGELGSTSCRCPAGMICCEDDAVCIDANDECGESLSSKSKAPGDERPWLTADGDRFELVTGDSPKCIGQDRSRIYWLDEVGRLKSVMKTGGRISRPRFDLPPQIVSHCAIVVDGGHLYVTMYGLGMIAKIPVPADPRWETGVDGAIYGALVTPSSLVVDESFVYVVERDSGSIKRLPKSPTSNSGDAGDGDGGMTLPADGELLARTAREPHALVSDAENLYWLDDDGLRRMAKSGGPVATLMSLTTGDDLTLARHAESEDRLFWTSGDDVWTMRLPDGTPRAFGLRDSEHESPWGTTVTSRPWTGAIAHDDLDVYFVSNSFIRRRALAGGAVTEFFAYRNASFSSDASANEPLAESLLVDGERLYWSDGRSIWSRRK